MKMVPNTRHHFYFFTDDEKIKYEKWMFVIYSFAMQNEINSTPVHLLSAYRTYRRLGQ